MELYRLFLDWIKIEKLVFANKQEKADAFWYWKIEKQINK